MQIISGTTEFHTEKPTAVAIGKFDGVHIGHQKLLGEILNAKKEGLLSAVFTFDPSPTAFFSGHAGKELTTKEEKRRLFRQLGIDILVEFPLNTQTASMSPERFVQEILHEKLQAAMVAAGTDLSFGDKGKGDSVLLRNLSERYGYQVRIIDKVEKDGVEVSSTYVRSMVEKGKMERAAALLGEPFSVMGTVIHGRQLGRKIGMPTVNLTPPPDKLLPPNGVYYSEVEFHGGKYCGVTNVGCKPTVDGSGQVTVETYIYDFAEVIYDTFITVKLLHFVRPERKFSSVEELKAAMEQNIQDGKLFFTR